VKKRSELDQAQKAEGSKELEDRVAAVARARKKRLRTRFLSLLVDWVALRWHALLGDTRRCRSLRPAPLLLQLRQLLAGAAAERAH
jgi:hypothetical protein